jgi:hypothetical protein
MLFVILYVGLVGLVAAGFTGSLWALVAGHPPSLALILKPHPLLPLAALAIALHGPMLMRYITVDPLRRWWAAIMAAGWCFLEGVFILTEVFGVA